MSDGNVVTLPTVKTLLNAPPIFKPFKYPWAYDAWKDQQMAHWLPWDVPMGDDIRDWAQLAPAQRNCLTHIFRFFTQQDVEVNDCYMTKYASVFKPTEVKMMLAAFADMETIHIAAYSLIIDTLGMPETTYNAFLGYKEMKDKHDYLQSFNVDNTYELAKTLAVFGAFTEGVQLFASFAMLMNFQRPEGGGIMKGMGQIVTYSARDESLHTRNIIRLFHTLCDEYAHEIPTQQLDNDIYAIARQIVEHEDHFIDLAFELGPMPGLTAEQVKSYVRYMADRRLMQLARTPIFSIAKNPLPWMDEMLNGVEFANFFETKPTEYSKASTQGDWDEDAFAAFA